MIRIIIPKILKEVDPVKIYGLVGYLNVYNYGLFRKHPAISQRFDAFTLDGIALVSLLQLVTGKQMRRVSPDFSSYFKPLFAYFSSQEIKVGFVGGGKEDMSAFQAFISEKYPAMNTTYFRHGYELNVDILAKELSESGTRVLILGLGSPLQEHYAIALKDLLNLDTIYTCGAFISQTAAGGTVYYPSWANKLHLRWLYRIYREPKLFKRYAIHYPAGIIRVLRDYYRPE